jgi:hypothetical protein
MSDIVKVIFDGDLGPLQQKQAAAKAELTAFASGAEAEIKGIATVGDSVGRATQQSASSFNKYYAPVFNDLQAGLAQTERAFKNLGGTTSFAYITPKLALLKEQIIDLQIASEKPVTASVFTQYETELRALQLQLAEYQAQLATAKLEQGATAAAPAAATQFNFGARPLQGYGGVFRATGLTNLGVTEAEGNVALQALGKLSRGTDSAVASQLALETASLRVSRAQKLAADSMFALAFATEEFAAAEATVIAAEQAEFTTEAELIAADNALLASTKALTAARAEAAVATEVLATAEAEAAVAGGAVAVSFGVALAVLLPLAAAGAVFALWTSRAKEDAAVLAKRAEEVASAYGRQLKYQQGISDELAKQRGEAQTSRELETYKGTLGGESVEQLQQRKKEIADILELQAKGPQQFNRETRQYELSTAQVEYRKKLTGELLAIEAEIYKQQQQKAGAGANLINQEFKIRQQAAEADKKDREQAAEEAKKGVEKVNEAVKGYRAAFESIFAGEDTSNPFVRIFTDADKKLMSFREHTKGLSDDLKALGENKLRIELSDKLFGARVDTSLEAENLRQIALKFRGLLPSDKAAETDSQYEARLKRQYLQAGGSSADFQLRTQDELAKQGGFLAAQRLVDNAQGLSGFSLQGAAFAAYNAFQRDPGTSAGTQYKLQRQIDAIDKFSPTDEAQRNLAERKLLSVASSLDPSKLTDAQRSRIADTAEHQALVTEQREIEGLKVAKEILEVNKRIDTNQAKLLEIANKGGIDAIKTEFTVKDQTKSGVTVEQRPTAAKQEDVNSTFLDQAGG